MGFCYFFPIYIKLPRRSSNSYHSQEAPVTWPNQVFYSLTHPPFHVAFVFCWLCLFLWLTAGYTVTQSHTLILCSFSLNNQPISILHTCCIHFLPQQNTDFYLTLPCKVPYLLCSISQLLVLIRTPWRNPPLLHDCSITSSLSLLWIHCFILTIKFIFQMQPLLSLLLHRQFFHAEELVQSFLYPSNYTLIFYVHCILCWTEVSSLWDPCI